MLSLKKQPKLINNFHAADAFAHGLVLVLLWPDAAIWAFLFIFNPAIWLEKGGEQLILPPGRQSFMGEL